MKRESKNVPYNQTHSPLGNNFYCMSVVEWKKEEVEGKHIERVRTLKQTSLNGYFCSLIYITQGGRPDGLDWQLVWNYSFIGDENLDC